MEVSEIGSNRCKQMETSDWKWASDWKQVIESKRLEATDWKRAIKASSESERLEATDGSEWKQAIGSER